MPPRKYADELIETAVEMREDGSTIREISDRLGMSRGAVEWHCLKLGADKPDTKLPNLNIGPMVVARGNHKVRRFTPEEDAEILNMHADGKSMSDIGRALGRKHNSIIGRLMTLARREERAA